MDDTLYEKAIKAMKEYAYTDRSDIINTADKNHGISKDDVSNDGWFPLIFEKGC